jgi:hypothetical protein
VVHPLAAFGEYLTLIQSPEPSQELLDAAMGHDPRTKLILVAESLQEPLMQLAIHDFRVSAASYLKRGQPHGERLGLIVRRTELFHWVEY